MMSAMKFRHELTYDAPPAEVFEMLADPAFREAACTAQDVISAEVHVERTGNGFNLTIDQQQKTDDLPSFARAFAGDSTRAIQREEWEDSTGATVRIEAPGKPSEVTGTITLRPEGSGTREIVELDLKIKVPLVGGKLEKLLAERITAGLDAEHGVGVTWLAGVR
jgi:carbon monoxide dehydrogenase subunit G